MKPTADTEKLFETVCQESGCPPEQVSKVATAALKVLHKIAYGDERNVTAALMQCYWMFGSEACYHLGGLLEEARIWTDSELSWSETLERLDPELKEYSAILDEWAALKSQERKLLDSR